MADRKYKIPLGGEVLKHVHGKYTIRVGCDLRASLLEEKVPLVSGGGLDFDVNKAGTLIHVVHGSGKYIRIRATGGESFKHGPYIYDRVVRHLADIVRSMPPEVLDILRDLD